jgi:hypothetical protein
MNGLMHADDVPEKGEEALLLDGRRHRLCPHTAFAPALPQVRKAIGDSRLADLNKIEQRVSKIQYGIVEMREEAQKILSEDPRAKPLSEI